MYTYFKVKNFRCFQELEFDDLALVNLIAGVNNVGKTALLEAIFLHCGAYNPALTVSINAFRGLEKMKLTVGTWAEHPMNSLFNQFDVSKEVELVGEDTVSGHRSLRLKAVSEAFGAAEVINEEGVATILDESNIHYVKNESVGVLSSSEVAKVLELVQENAGKPSKYLMIMDGNGVRVEPLSPSPPFQTFFQGARMRIPLSEQDDRYGNLQLRREQDQVLRILQIIEPRLEDLRSIKSILHGDIGASRPIPLPLMGEGVARLADLAVNIGNAPNGVVLIDEIENGLHHSVMSKIWKAIALAARESNTQIFATTHSWECIRAAHEAFASGEKYDFRLHRLGWLDGKIGRVTYDKETLAASLKHELEVR